MKFLELSSFEQWFLGSKVVDKHGRPLRMYHVTKNEFEHFAPGSHFGTATAAKHRFNTLSPKEKKGFERKVDDFRTYPVYLSIKNPLKVEDLTASDESALFNYIKQEITKKTFLGAESRFKDFDLDYAWKHGAYKALEKLGYDGIVYKNNIEDRGKYSWVIFRPDQVRFALSNMSEAVKKFPGLTPAFIKTIQKMRHEQRIENGGGGACHLVSEWIEWKYGWDRVSGTYTSPDYKEPQVTGHYWNLLPDGSILDATADQLGEGKDVIVVHPSDKNYHRYRPEFSHEFDADYSRNSEPFEDHLRNYFPHFDRNTIHRNGDDYEWAQKLDKERGHRRGVTHPDEHEKYVKMQKKLYGYDAP